MFLIKNYLKYLFAKKNHDINRYNLYQFIILLVCDFFKYKLESNFTLLIFELWKKIYYLYYDANMKSFL